MVSLVSASSSLQLSTAVLNANAFLLYFWKSEAKSNFKSGRANFADNKFACNMQSSSAALTFSKFFEGCSESAGLGEAAFELASISEKLITNESEIENLSIF